MCSEYDSLYTNYKNIEAKSQVKPTAKSRSKRQRPSETNAKSLKLKPRAKSQLIKVRSQEPKARSQTQSETKGINKTRF